MLCIHFFISSLFLHNINLVSSAAYACNHNAECGCSKNDAQVNRIVGGELAVNSSWGWAVSLQRNGKHFCGGSVISTLHVITAAHCVTGDLEIKLYSKVVAGINILSQRDSSSVQVRSIDAVISHNEYNGDTKINDIAILRLDQPLNISNGKGTARLCIPRVVPTSSSSSYPIPNSPLVAIGWGVLKAEETSIPTNRHLRQVTVYGRSAHHRSCRHVINNRRVQFCAGVTNGGKGNIITMDLYL